MSKPSRSRRFRAWGRVESLETRALMTIGVTAPLPDLAASVGSAPAVVDLGGHFKDPDGRADFAIFNTTLGTIPVLMTPSTTPRTVANFVKYVDRGAYANSIVHRSVPGFVWQTGGFRLNAAPGIEQIAADAPVQNEFGASNTRGTVAMAKVGGDPDSATSQFFFNLSDANAANLDHQNGGFTVFGRVVGQSGMAVMDAIAAAPVASPSPYAPPLDSIPLLNYKAGAAVQPENLVLIRDVTTSDRAYSAVSDAPGVAAVTLQRDRLVVTPLAAGTATVTVVGHGADGSTATETFTVHVAPGAEPAPPTTPPRASVRSPTVGRGLLPATVVAGTRARIQQMVALSATSGPVAARPKVDLVLAPTTGAGAEVTIATAAPNVRLQPGRQARVPLVARGIAPTVAAGAYRVLVSVTDPDGARTTIDTGRTLDVQAS